MLAGLIERRQCGVERFHGRFDQTGSGGMAPLQPADGRRQGRHRGTTARHHGLCLAQVLGDFFGLHHGGAAPGKFGFLAGLGGKFGQLVGSVAQPFGLALCPLDLGAVTQNLLLRLAARRPQAGYFGRSGLQPAIGVEQEAVRGGIDERAFIVLSVDFHQRAADAAQHLHTDRLIVEERTGAAVGELHPAQDEIIIARNVVRPQDCPCRMVRRDVESCGHLTLLGPQAHQAGIPASPEREREGIEQNRFAGAGFSSQHR